MEKISSVHPNGEPTLESIGLGGYSPVGLVQHFMEFMHISYDVPWWATIVIGMCMCIYVCMFLFFIFIDFI